MTQEFTISTLHRGKYMLCFFILLLLAGGLTALLPFKEIYKVVAILITIPINLYLSIKFSLSPSQWSLSDSHLTIFFNQKKHDIAYDNIDHIRSLTRNGGNLFVIYLKNKSPMRFWRNKLFQSADDHEEFHEALIQSKIEYFKL